MAFTTTSTLTPNAVKAFYKGMSDLSSVSNENDAYDISKMMKECFHVGSEENVSGVELPNDFRFFKYDEKSISHNDSTHSSANYVNKLKDYIYKEQVLHVSVGAARTVIGRIGSQPDSEKGRLSQSNYNYYTTFITKKFTMQNVTKVFNDTVISDFTTGKICEIHNGNGKPSISIHGLRVKAALAYKLENYEEAYKCYEEILALSKNDADALYRIGLMTYFQQGCHFPKKSVARQKGKAYMEKAKYNNYDYSIREKAENILHYWEYPRL